MTTDSPNSIGRIRAHFHYIRRDGAGLGAEEPELFGSRTEDPSDFQKDLSSDPHHFRIIVSPENPVPDLEDYTRRFVEKMEQDLATKLEWAAVTHHDTEHSHAHIVLRCVDENGRPFRINNTYLTQGIRHNAQRIATRILGRVPEYERRLVQERQVPQIRLMPVDNAVENSLGDDNMIDSRRLDEQARRGWKKDVVRARANKLAELGYAEIEPKTGTLRFRPDWKNDFRHATKLLDVYGRVSFHFGGATDGVVDLDTQASPNRFTIPGVVRGKGMADELSDIPYLAIEGADGHKYHLTLSFDKTRDLRPGDIVSISPTGAAASISWADELLAEYAGARKRAGMSSEFGRTSIAEWIDREKSWSADQKATRLKALFHRVDVLENADILEKIAPKKYRIPDQLLKKVGDMMPPPRFTRTSMPIRWLNPKYIENAVNSPEPTWLDRFIMERKHVGTAEVQQIVAARKSHLATELKSDPFANRQAYDVWSKPLIEMRLAGIADASSYKDAARKASVGGRRETFSGKVVAHVSIAGKPHSLIVDRFYKEYALLPGDHRETLRVGRHVDLDMDYDPTVRRLRLSLARGLRMRR